MALKRISDYTSATTPLAGTEMLEVETAGGAARKVTAQDIADLASGTAADTTYDNSTSGLTATDVQAAIDELAASGGGVINIVTTITSGTITPAGDTDLVRPAALTAALTIANPSSTPADGAGFVVDLIDDGTTRALTWGSKYANRMATLPATTTVSKRHRIGFEYNAADDKLYCMYAQVQP